MNKWFLSSTGSQDLSLTIKGLLVGLIPLFIIAGKYFQVELTYDEIFGVIEGLTLALSTVMVLIGLIRKVANKF